MVGTSSIENSSWRARCAHRRRSSSSSIASPLGGRVSGCPHCTEYLLEMRTTIAALGRIEPAALSRIARDDLVALYRNWRAS